MVAVVALLNAEERSRFPTTGQLNLRALAHNPVLIG